MTGKGDWQSEPFYFTDVAETPTSFWYRVAVPNFTNYIHAAGVVITQRVATVVSADGTWVYDGSEHTTNELSTCEGFVDGETYMTNWFGAITTVGTTNNEFAIDFNGTAKESNYTLVATTGTLEVVNAVLPDPEDDDPDKDPEAGPFPGPDLPGPTPPPAPTNNTDGTWSELSDYDWIGVYDGERHTFDVTALSNRLDGLQFYGNPYTLSYSLTGEAGSWQSDPFYFTNVDETPTSFWYRVSADNFTDYIHAAGVIITQRVVTLVFPKAEKVFDGTTDAEPVTTNLVGEVDNMVGSEEFDAVGEGVFVMKSVGQRAFRLTNLTITPESGARFQNYLIRYGADGEYVFDPDGSLPPDADLPGEITSAEPKVVDSEDEKGPGYDPTDPAPQSPPSVTNEFGDAVTLSDFDYIGVYDGDAHTIDTNGLWVSVNAKEWFGETPVVEYSIDGTDWQADPFEYTDAVATSFWYRVYADNFKTNVHSVGVTITQRVVTIEFPTASKVFDDTPDCDPLVTNVVGAAQNMVGDERFDAIAYGGFLDDYTVGDDRDFVITNLVLDASNGAKYRNYRILFGANGSIEFLPDDVPAAEGPASFGTDDESFPAADDPALRLPGEILECEPKFAAEIAWGFNPNTGVYFAQLKVTCLNTTDTFDFAKGSMRFDFQDRVEDGVLKLGLWDARQNQSLSVLGKTESIDGSVYSKFDLTDPDPSVRNGGWAPAVSHTYGPSDLSALSYSAADRISTPEMRVNARVNPSLFDIDARLVYEWGETTGTRRMVVIPVVNVGASDDDAGSVGEPPAPAVSASPAPERTIGDLTALDKKSVKPLKGNYFGLVFAGEGNSEIVADVTWKIAATGKATGTVLANGVKTKFTGRLYSDADGDIVLDTDAKSKVQLRIVRYAGETVWTGDLGSGVLYGRFTDKKALKSWKRSDNAEVFVADGSVVATMTAKISTAGKATVKTKLPSKTTISGSGQILVLDAAFVAENLPGWSDGTDKAFMHLSKKVKKQVVEGAFGFGSVGVVDGGFVYGGTAYGVSGK